jgi:hypothetical protein
MLGGFIKFVIAVGIASFCSVLLVYAFDDWYQDLERRRRARWREKQGRRYE